MIPAWRVPKEDYKLKREEPAWHNNVLTWGGRGEEVREGDDDEHDASDDDDDYDDDLN